MLCTARADIGRGLLDTSNTVGTAGDVEFDRRISGPFSANLGHCWQRFRCTHFDELGLLPDRTVFGIETMPTNVVARDSNNGCFELLWSRSLLGIRLPGFGSVGPGWRLLCRFNRWCVIGRSDRRIIHRNWSNRDNRSIRGVRSIWDYRRILRLAPGLIDRALTH